MTSYRRHKSQPVQAQVFRAIARVLGDEGLSLSSVSPTELSGRVATMFDEARSPIRLHGSRVEEMFAYVAAAIGSVKAIKREETEDLILSVPAEIAVPDFRVVLEDGSDVLVEVKNFHDKDPKAEPRLEVDYLRKLAAYGALFSRRVFVAIYWSAFRRWTLHGVSDLIEIRRDPKATLWFGEAYRLSEMSLLGDVLLGTEFPLKVRFGVTSKQQERTGSTSTHLIRFDSVEMSVNGKPIRNERDQKIAFGLMVYGGWEEKENVEMDGDQIVSIEHSYSPHESDPRQDFAPVAALSGLASAEFNDLTVDSESIERLRPQTLPSPPYPRVGEDYKGVDLPLWLLIIKPPSAPKPSKKNRRGK